MTNQQNSVFAVLKARFTVLLAALVIAGFSAPLQAEGWFVGGGILGVSFQEDFDNVDNSGGIGFSGGYRFGDGLSAELLFNLSAHDDTMFEDDVLQSSFMAGAKYSFGDGKFKPYAVAGLSLNSLAVGDLKDADDFDDLDTIGGFGLYLGIGADIFVAKQHAINVGFRSNRWNDKDGGTRYDVQTDIFSVAYNFYFAD